MRSSFTAPVVAVDIDGTTADYHGHFTWFASLYLDRALWCDWQPHFKGSFSRALHLSKPTYRDAKLAFRQGGLKRFMPPRPGAAELTAAVRKAGAQVWICTTRPYMRLDNIDPDTRHWLKRNRIQWDHMIYGENKYKDLVSQVGRERIVAVYDDLPEQLTAADKLGLRTILSGGMHNDWWTPGEGTVFAPNCYAATAEIIQLVKNWKKEH